jgi:hypothetical protein
MKLSSDAALIAEDREERSALLLGMPVYAKRMAKPGCAKPVAKPVCAKPICAKPVFVGSSVIGFYDEAFRVLNGRSFFEFSAERGGSVTDSRCTRERAIPATPSTNSSRTSQTAMTNSILVDLDLAPVVLAPVVLAHVDLAHVGIWPSGAHDSRKAFAPSTERNNRDRVIESQQYKARREVSNGQRQRRPITAQRTHSLPPTPCI